MKNMKKFLSLTLLFLLFSSEISICSWSWWESIVKAPLQSIAQSIDKETAKKLFPLVLLASVIGFYYWMSKKGKNSDEEGGRVSLPISSLLQPQIPSISPIIPVPNVPVVTSPMTTAAAIYVPKEPLQPTVSTTTPIISHISSEVSGHKKPQDLLTQYRVYSQTESNGGGPASCGYHALFRSMQIVQSKS